MVEFIFPSKAENLSHTAKIIFNPGLNNKPVISTISGIVNHTILSPAINMTSAIKTEQAKRFIYCWRFVILKNGINKRR